MSLADTLTEQRLFPGVTLYIEPASVVPEWWAAIPGNLWSRVRPDARMPVIRDGPLAWTDALEDICREIRQNLWQRFKGEIPSNAIFGPQEKLFERVEQESRHTVVVWLEDASASIDTALGSQHFSSGALKSLGPTLAVVRGEMPLRSPRAATPGYVEERDNLVSQSKFIQIYDRGLSNVFRALQGTNTSHTRLIHQLDCFWRTAVKWGSVNSRDELRSAEVSPTQSYFVYIEPGHRLYRIMETGIHGIAHPDHPPYMCFMKPYDLHEKWAGLAALHELQHLHAKTYPHLRYPASPEGRAENAFVSYDLQIAGMHALSAGKLQVGLDALVRYHSLETEEDVRRLYDIKTGRGKRDLWCAAMEDLDRCLTPEKPRSSGEWSLRCTSYGFALMFHIIGKRYSGAEERREACKRFIRDIYSIP